MIEDKSSLLNFNHGLSRSWMTDSQMNPMVFVTSKTEKSLTSDPLQLPQRLIEPLPTAGIYNQEQLNHVQSPCLDNGTSSLQTPQVVPNLDEKGVTFGNTNISPGLCLSDPYGYETGTSDEWALDEDDSLMNIEDCLNPNWECSLIRQSIEDQELEIYLPRNLSPTPLDHLYSTIPRSSKEIKCNSDEYGRRCTMEPPNGQQLVTVRGEKIYHISVESARTIEPSSKGFPDTKAPLCTDITRSYSESSGGYCNTHDLNNRIKYDCLTLDPSSASQTTRSGNDDHKYAHKQTKRSSSLGIQNVPIMSTKVMPAEPRPRDARQPQEFPYPENVPFSPAAVYSSMERASDCGIVSKYQFPLGVSENNNNVVSPVGPRLQNLNFCSPVSDQTHFKNFSFNNNVDNHCKTLRTLEKSAYVLPNVFCSQVSEDRSVIDSDHSNGSGVTSETGSARLTHNDIERQRRNQMKVKFDHLKACLPDISKCERSPKILVLNRARDYIRWLQKESCALEIDKEKMKTTNRVLLQKLVLLTGQVKDMAGL